MALRLLLQEQKVKRGRLRNKEEIIMDWAPLIIGTFTALLGVIALYFIWLIRLFRG
jgi:hypothetical protein